jgi:ribose 5-phosphate isomerase B
VDPAGLASTVVAMQRFDIITEADARLLQPGSTVELAPHGHVTPLASDTLRSRRITVVRTDAGSEQDLADLVPVHDVRTVAVGSDHTGIALRRRLIRHLRGHGLAVEDLGTEGPEAVDYPDVAAAVALMVARKEADAGIVIDGAGIGSAIAANKIPGIRAAMCTDETTARYAREHNGANVLTLGAGLLTPEQAEGIVEVWLSAAIREPRYIRRLAKIRRLEERRRQI